MATYHVTNDAPGGGNGDIDDPFTLAEAISTVAAGDLVNVKSGTYLTTAVTTFATAGDGDNLITWRGYVNTPGDATVPVVIIDVQDNDANIIDITGAFQRFEYFEARNNPTWEKNGMQILGAEGVICYRCRSELTGQTGLSTSFSVTHSFGSSFIECESTDWGNGPSGASTSGINLSGGHNSWAFGCIAHNGHGWGFQFGQTGVCGMVNCISAHNAQYGIHFSKSVGSEYMVGISNCTIWGNDDHGIYFSISSANNNLPVIINNCIIGENGTISSEHGIHSNGTGLVASLVNVAFFNNFGDDVNASVTVWEPQDRITLTADPFVDSSATGLDFRLTLTATQLLSVGSPKRYIINGEFAGWENFLDIGGVQTQACNISADNLSADAANKIADHVLRRSSVTMETATTPDALDLQSLYGVVARLTNKMEVSDATLTVTKADLYEELGHQTVTQSSSANPVDSVD